MVRNYAHIYKLGPSSVNVPTTMNIDSSYFILQKIKQATVVFDTWDRQALRKHNQWPTIFKPCQVIFENPKNHTTLAQICSTKFGDANFNPSWTRKALSRAYTSADPTKLLLVNKEQIKHTQHTGCWFVGGDDLTGALHDLQLQYSWHHHLHHPLLQ